MNDTLAGKRILIVEDEHFIASDIRRMLAKAGAVVVGPAANLEAGLSLAEEPIDAAILDVNLEETLSFPIADRIGSRSIPYMFLTGYDGWSLPTAHRDTARLAKPFAPGAIVSMMGKLLAPMPEAS